MAGNKHICILSVLLLVVLLDKNNNGVNGEGESVPCFFIFGDSLVDNGNNNRLPTSAKVNYQPYGIDFPGATPTGRFSNGLNLVDFLGQLLGFRNFIPPFASASGDVILKGVNYASGAAGIREESGQHLGARISMDKQLVNHQITILRMNDILQNYNRSKTVSTQEYLNKCLYYVGMGSNDYLNNYFLPQIYPTSRMFTPDQFATLLINQYQRQIQRLYSSGARKVALFGLGAIGCIPYAISSFGTKNGSVCVDEVNQAVQLFNQKLVSLVDQFNNKFNNAKFIYVNSFGIGSGDPTSAGFKFLNTSCCPSNNIGQCIPNGKVCEKRDLYVFWDAIHPTQAVNGFTATRSYTALLPSDTYPIDIKRLAALQL
ncbi:GDSL esterase/lipase At1g29670-like [Humulus lupulus]|uniref:GDSL esterase/lipase At1g29670-like n=1 Tax=Humulus lupulus TaxID=3486 RepID=UPI002B4147C2|nr:GDSL esterase/lipase At1g29670-like [Humulus lupulus]